MFERSQGKLNNLDCYSFLEYFALIAKFTCSKLDTNLKYFCMLKKALKPWKWTIFVFSKLPFFLSNVHHSFFKIGKDFNIIDCNGKRTWINEFFIYNPFEHIWLKNAFDCENYGFWKCGFIKNSYIYTYIYIYMIKGMNA